MTNPNEAAARALRTRLADLGPRLGSAAVLIAVATVSWWVGSIAFFVAWLIAALVVHFEWERIVGGANLDARLAIGTLCLIAAAIAIRSQASGFAVLIIVAAAIVSGFQAGPGQRLWSGLGVAYAGALILAVLTLRSSFPFGRWAIGWLFAIVWGTDACAYFAGRLIGGPEIPAAHLALEDLVGHRRRYHRRRADRPWLSRRCRANQPA